MKTNDPTLLCTVCMFICTLILVVYMQQKPIILAEAPQPQASANLLTQQELADYLRLKADDIDRLIVEDQTVKPKVGSWDTYQYLPYIELGGKRIFLKSEVDKWLDYISRHGRRHI